MGTSLVRKRTHPSGSRRARRGFLRVAHLLSLLLEPPRAKPPNLVLQRAVLEREALDLARAPSKRGQHPGAVADFLRRLGVRVERPLLTNHVSPRVLRVHHVIYRALRSKRHVV
eukprot:31028-Pelagococcus_subviridis.AAC.11